MIRSLMHDGFVVSVDAAPEDHEWLEAFLGPAFGVVPDTAGDARVRMAGISRAEATTLCGDQALTPCGGGALAPRERRIAFALDSTAIRLAEWPVDGGSRLHDAGGSVVFDVAADGRTARLRHYGDRRDARTRLMRVVREYAHNHSLRTGGLMLHAAGVAVDGRAVLIAGDKGVGKTTAMLRVVTGASADYLSNDRILIRCSEDIVAHGIPTIAAVRAGSRDVLSEVAARLQTCGDFRETESERQAHGPASPARSGDTWHVSPRQLCDGVGCEIRQSSPLAAVLFLTADRPAAPHLRLLDRGESAEALSEALLGRPAGAYTSDVFVATPGGAPDKDEMFARCRALASRIDCFSGSASDATLLVRQCLAAR